ncbi:MAG: type IV pilus secretin PilQ [Deltaproteobacteria bacterium]|nr:type IV pilus secretin PilQ [Deltaproteobacteria bacterium]
MALAVAFAASGAAARADASNQIREVKVVEQGGKTTVTVVGSARPSYTAFRLSSPKRLVVDLADAEARSLPSLLDTKTGLVEGLAVSQYSSNETPVSRVMINFRDDAAYRMATKGNDLVIVLTGAPAAKGEAPVRGGTTADMERAKAETAIARDEVSRLKTENAARASEAEAARREAEEARARLAAATAELQARTSRDGASRDAEAKRAAAEVARLRAQVDKAASAAQVEQKRREDLEKRLADSQANLAKAEQAKRTADEARVAAENEATRAKLTATESAAVSAMADTRLKEALTAQRKAAVDYRKAAEGQRAELLNVLNARERETKDANERLADAERARAETKGALAAAMARVGSTTQASEEASKALTRIESRLKKELAAAEAGRTEAERSARIAREMADRAIAAKDAAEKKMESLRAETEASKAEADRRADEKVAAAQAALNKAEERLAAAQAATTEAEKRATRSEERVASAETKAKSADERAAGAEKELAEVKAAMATKQTGKSTQEELRVKRLAEMNGDKQPPAKAVAEVTSAALVTDVRFVADGHGQRVVVKTNRPLEYSTSMGPTGKATIFMRKADLKPTLERTLDVSGFGGVVRKVSSYKDGDQVKIEVFADGPVTSSVARQGDEIVWTFVPKAAAPKPPEAITPIGDKTKTVLKEDAQAYESPLERTAAYAATGTIGDDGKKKRYTGRHIDLDFKNADIHNILRLLADVGQVNIVTADDVSGEVTIRMRDVEWDHALDVILQAKHLGMVREGNLIRVAPLTTLEKEREMEIARRKQNMALEPLETRLIPVSYARAEELSPQAKDLLSERGNLSVDKRTNVVIARDTTAHLDQIELLMRNLDTQTPQVLIEARIVEATSTYAREIGIQWGGDFSASSATANPTGLAFPSTVGVAGGATDSKAPIMGLSPTAAGRPNPNFAVNLPAAVGTGSGGALGITLGSIANNANLNLRLSALEDSGTLRILSSPKILTLDNKEAKIEQGTLIPYSQVSAQGVQTSFKEAKLSLTVTPHVTADGSVLLELSMTRDEPDFNNKGAGGDPTILKRAAETELLVNDGHTAVIGGIFTRNTGMSYKKVPFFADIPIIGWLFKSRADSDRRSEMLIFITPRIVNRAESIGQ